MRRLTILAFVAVASLSGRSPALAQAPDDAGDRALLANLPKHELFDLILRATVRDERVDYARIRDEYAGDLELYLRHLARVDAHHLGRRERLAYYINLYNATMIKAVVDRYKPGYSVGENDFAVFKEPLVRTAVKAMSLNDLEHGLIRPSFKDPRVHAALVCAARSCPPLLPRAYVADDLDEVLDENMKRFVLDRTRNPVDDAKRELKLSKIFEWYADDFGGRDKLAAYVGKVAGKDYAGYTVSFVDYSWELNDLEKKD
jgi:hypothetical protein